MKCLSDVIREQRMRNNTDNRRAAARPVTARELYDKLIEQDDEGVYFAHENGRVGLDGRFDLGALADWINERFGVK